ncbi:hypothetical protein [Pseudonocardia thermophila]|uniref:hypothetical protein n=1 Tax=Pseudonocardia thermophila TaxID=1848 RepID=UPI00248DE543|nr:hypothetical protein [Pseudonocardia thermophila]
MLVRTDDEVYRVDSVWLGPPRATFPWRARYVSYGVGLIVMILVMFVQRRLGIGLDFISVAWALLITIVVTRFIGKRIDYERPLSQVLTMFRHEVAGPRPRTTPTGGPVRSGHVRITPARSAARGRTAERRTGGRVEWTTADRSTTRAAWSKRPKGRARGTR